MGRLEDGRVVFVPGGLPGEQVLVELPQPAERARFRRAHLVQVLTPHPARRTAACAVADRCGGCQLQHLDAASALDLKAKRVADALRHIAGIAQPPMGAPIASPEPFGYRQKAALPATEDPEGICFGFYAPGSHEVVVPETCMVQSSLGQAAVRAVTAIMRRLGYRAYDERTGRHGIRHLVVRTTLRGTGLMVTVVSSDASLPREERFVSELVRAVPALSSLYLNVNPQAGNTILGPTFCLLYGVARLEEHLDGLRFLVSPAAFFQVNPAAAEKLFALAVQEADLHHTEHALDLYCGTGVMALFMARQARQVIGVESVSAAIDDARLNAAHNGFDNTRFVCADTARYLEELQADPTPVDCVVLDPPRKGAAEAVPGLLRLNSPRLVYVSCDPATLARDVRSLVDGGYRLQRATPVDLFPQTAHIETVALLTRF